LAFARCTVDDLASARGTHARGKALPHSCVPSVQLQMSGDDLDESDEPPALPRVRLVKVRSALCPDERPSIAWIDVSSIEHWEARGAELRDRLGENYVCACERCTWERGTPSRAPAQPSGSPPPPHAMLLARDAIEDGRYSPAVKLLEAWLRSSERGGQGAEEGDRVDEPGAQADVTAAGGCDSVGDAWMMLGTAFLSLDRWIDAHTAWARGARLVPSHELLQKVQRKHDLYQDGGGAAGQPDAREPEPLSGAECEVHALRGGALPARVVVTTHPLLSLDECAAAIDLAEAHATQSGGWTTTRHHAVPTTDVPVHEVPGLLSWFRRAMTQKLAPMLARYFGVTGSAIRVHDAFLVRYRAGSQAHLPLHADESQLSLTIVLNDAFVGGGTFFADLGRALSPAVGHAIAFDGHALHGGEPIVQGTRYIIAAFLFVDDGSEGTGSAASAAAPVTATRRSALEALFGEHASNAKRARHGEHGGGESSVVGEAQAARATPTASAGPGGFTFNF
jgi:hypothetical protein